MPRIIRQVLPIGTAACSLKGQGPQDGLRLILVQLEGRHTGGQFPMLGLELHHAIQLRDILSLAIIEEEGKAARPPLPPAGPEVPG